MDKIALLDEVAAQVRVCQACELHRSRKNAVPGEGNVNSEILFIGEAPGFHENEQGRPFVGQAGKLLDYSAHAWESFTAITLAYVLINAVIMLVMTLVERKVRLPGNMGGK